MKIYAEEKDIEKALRKTNMIFNGNIRFKRFERLNGKCFTVTLTVFDSRKKGSRRAPDGRRISAACWHVHGTFMDALPEGTKIITSELNGTVVKYPGDEWDDWLVQDFGRETFISELCNCAEFE